ncbi:hypothetical protein [Thermomonospora umbrina]|uniref:Uncharacterized protein n=1 Tax=Thermomonospora umbrina TaxID=111806 RepID=A0A3D9T1A8_9ACTN|nr:hypothetical protein [Thermomonospora umbrina]REF00611.1 hypothetical protein DFJ69_6166 [Thermomonospora umbrina]
MAVGQDLRSGPGQGGEGGQHARGLGLGAEQPEIAAEYEEGVVHAEAVAGCQGSALTDVQTVGAGDPNGAGRRVDPDHLVSAVDLNHGGGALLIGLRLAHDQPVAYMTGLAVHRASGTHT